MSAPVGRPAAPRQLRQSARSWPHSGPVRAAEDSPEGVSFVRISSRRLEAIRSGLTEEERAVLYFLSTVRLATGFQIARRLWAAPSPTDPRARSARRALARLERHRVIERLGRRLGGVRGGSSSIVYGLGTAGRRLLSASGQARRLGTPGDRHVAHTLAVTELGVALGEAMLAGRLELIETQAEPDCWRAFLGPMGARVVLKPDLFLRLGAGDHEDRWFVEVDRATEASATIRTKALGYLAHLRSGDEQHAHGVYPRVLWTAPDIRRREQLTAILGRLPDPAPRLFTVWLFDEVVGRLIAESDS
jgi:Replication-relaxation